MEKDEDAFIDSLFEQLVPNAWDYLFMKDFNEEMYEQNFY